MIARWVVSLVALCVGCSRVPISSDPTPEDYCAERDRAWVRAFPDEAKAYPGLANNKTCPDVIRKEQTTEPEFWKRRVRCMRDHILTNQEGKDANRAYVAMATCEGGGPQPAK